MKAIVLKGKYGYKPDQITRGLIVLFQIESMDSTESIQKAANRIATLAATDKIITVPFSHISNDVKLFEEAAELSKVLNATLLKISHGGLESVPFGAPKALYLESDGIVDVKLLTFRSNQKDLVKAIYNHHTKKYDQHMFETGHYRAQEALLLQVAPYIKEPIIDLGAGTGFLAKKILDNNYVREIYINDISEAMIDKARARLRERPVYFSLMDAESIATQDKYRTIICCNLLYYLSDIEQAIRNWKFSLTESGHILLLEEEPFLFPSGANLCDFSSELELVHNTVKLNEIIDLFKAEQFDCLWSGAEAIDARHRLRGFVLQKR